MTTWTRWFCLFLFCICGGVSHAASPIVWVPTSNTVIKLYNAAADALNRGDPTRAEGRARKAIEAQESFGEAHLLLGTALARQGRLQEALDVLQALDQRAPGRASVLTELSVTWFAKEDFGRADAYAMDAVGRNPDEDAAWQALTLVRRRSGDLGALQSALEIEQSRNPRPAVACFLVQSLVSLERRQEAEEEFVRCQELGGGQFVENATRALGAWLEQSPEGPVALMAESTEAFNRRDYARAAKLAGAALEAGAPPVQGRLLRAESRYRNGDFDSARKDLRAVLGEQGSWVTVQQDGSMTGVLTDVAARNLRERLVGAAAVAVLLDARDGEDWRSSLSDARAAFDDAPRFRAVEAEALYVVGEAGKAWASLLTALQRGDDPRGLAHVAGELGFGAAAVASAEAIELIQSRGTPLAVYNLASGLANAHLAAACLRVVGGLVGPTNESFARAALNIEEWSSLAVPIRSLHYSCAVQSGRIDLAERLGTEAGWTTPLEFDDVWAHALRLLEDESYDLLSRVLEGSGARESTRAEAAIDMAVYCEVQLGDLDGAVSICERDPCGPAARLEVGIALVLADRPAEAELLLARACGELKGKQRNVCRDWLARSKGT